MGLKAPLALLLFAVCLPWRAAARSFRTRTSFDEISESIGGLTRFGGTKGGTKFWTVSGNHLGSAALQVPSTILTTTILTTTTMTTTIMTTTTMTTTINLLLTTTMNAAMAAAQAAAAGAAAQASAAEQSALEAQQRANRSMAEQQANATEAPAPPPPSPTQAPLSYAANLPDASSFATEMQGMIDSASSAAAAAVTDAVHQAMSSHVHGAMDSAVDHWKESSSKTPPFCDELPTPAPTTVPVDASATTTGAPGPTTFPYKLYGEEEAYCIMRVTGVPTTTVDLGSSELGDVKVVDASDFEFWRKRGKSPPNVPVPILFHSPDSKAVQSDKVKELSLKKPVQQQGDKSAKMPIIMKKAQAPAGTASLPRVPAKTLETKNATAKSTSSQDSLEKKLLDLGIPKDRVVEFTRTTAATTNTQGKLVKPIAAENNSTNLTKAVKAEKVNQTTAKQKPLEPPKHKEVNTTKAVSQADAIAMGDAAEEALKKMNLTSDAGREPYYATGLPPGVEF